MLFSRVLEITEIVWAVATALGCHQNLLLKTPHILVTGHGEIKLVWTVKLSVCWLTFTVPEGTMQAAKGDESAMVVLANCNNE